MADLGLKDKVALITGSTRGLGRAIAEKLAEEKAKVIITGTNEEKAKSVAEYIAKTYEIGVVPASVQPGASANCFQK